jgi:hypothetical protein
MMMLLGREVWMSVAMAETDECVAAFLIPTGSTDLADGQCLCTVDKDLLLNAPGLLLAFRELAASAARIAIAQQGLTHCETYELREGE